MRVGSSFSRLKANTPAVNGKLPGTFSVSCQRRISPSSSYFGSATLGTCVPERETVVSAERISLPRILTTYSSPVYAALVCGHMSSSLRARGSSCFSRSSMSASSTCSALMVVAMSCRAASTSDTRSLAARRSLGKSLIHHGPRCFQLLPLARDLRLLLRPAVIATHGVDDVGKVARARRRHDDVLSRRRARRDPRKLARSELQSCLTQ